MGKTATVASLILSNPSSAERVSDSVFKSAMRAEGSGEAISNYGLTLVITNHTLVQQWADEIAKFAPGLKILMHFGLSGKKRDQAFAKLRDYDVLLTTPHITMPPAVVSSVRFHRMVVDEAHLLEQHGVGTMGGKADALNRYHTKNLWLVTGTPFSTGLHQLSTQSQLLGHWFHGLKLSEVDKKECSHYNGRYTMMLDNPEVVERLKKLMIKHSKSQRIGGEVALSLPATEAKTVWLDMSPGELVMYKHHGCADRQQTLNTSQLANQLALRRKACVHLYDIVPVKGADETAWDREKGEYRESKFTLQDPKQAGTFPKAAAAFLRLHVSRDDDGSFVPKPLELTKYKALLSDLQELRAAEPNMRVVIFTEYDEIQQRLVELLKPKRGTAGVSPSGASSSADADRPTKRHSGGGRSGTRSSRSMADSPSTPSDAEAGMIGSTDDGSAVGGSSVSLSLAPTKDGGVSATLTLPSGADGKQSDGEKAGALGVDGLQVYEFNAKTPPARRHKLIKDFQEGKDEGAKVFVVTFRTAAVGITLTAANRVYLFEPSLDPAQEIQAAGRIHRLGQKKEVLVKRFVFRQSIEEAILDLHAKISSGNVVITDGQFPQSAVELFRKHGIEQPHDFEDGEYVEKTLQNTCPFEPSGNSSYGKRVQETKCRTCGFVREVKGTTTWWGKGYYAFLDGKTTDFQPHCPSNWHSNLTRTVGGGYPGYHWQPPADTTTAAAGPSGTTSEDAKPEDLDAKPVPVMSLQPTAGSGPPVISLDSDDDED